jgi:BirA family transcriptional regulator, biotin operon repressor / biotin---[acetyl-CoA-carboxylase] ligase
VAAASRRAGEHPRVVAATGPGTAWSEVLHLDEVTSTHDVALSRLREGAGPGLVVVADRQTHGRGRAGRGWEDGPTPDASLMLTATVRAAAGELTLAPLAVGLAVADDVGDEVGLTLQLKWPNDVLVDGRKCVGVLVERHVLPAPAGDVMLLGVGIDVDWRGVDRSGERGAWTSLAEERGRDVDRFAVLGALLPAIARRIAAIAADPHGLLTDYRRACVTLGQDVQAQGAGGAPVTGRAVDVDAMGRLLVDTGRGTVAIAAGDVAHVRPTA